MADRAGALPVAGWARDLLSQELEGVQHVTADGVVSITRFHYDAGAGRIGCLIGTLLDEESAVVWQSMIVDDDNWYIGSDPDSAPSSFDDLIDRAHLLDWVQVAGTGLATSPLSVLYWLLGTLATAPEDPPGQTPSDGLDWHVVSVSATRAIDLASDLDVAGVRESFEQAGVSQDLLTLHVGLEGRRIAGVSWADRSDFVADHRFWSPARQRPIPLPQAGEQRDLADYFLLLGERNPLIHPPSIG